MKNLKFFKSGFCEKLKLLLIPIGLLIGSINTAWAYVVWGGKTFYIDNSIVNWSPMHIKFNNSTDNQPWCQAIEGTSYCYYYFSSDWKDYEGFTFIQGDNWDSKTAQSTYEKYDVQPSSYAVFVIKGETTASGEYKVGFFKDTKRAIKDTRVYFDATPVAGWGDKAYLRYGFDCVAHADPMTKFPGTASLFYIDIKESYYAKYAIANNAGWTGAHNVSQPSNECEPNDVWRITQSLAFSETDINNGYTVTTMVPTNSSATDHSCAWWNYNKNEGSDIPTQTVTINPTTNGKIRVEYTNTSGEETYWEGSSGTSLTVPQSAIITVRAIGNAGYDASSLTVGGGSFTSGNTYTVTATTSISATFVTAYAFVQGRMHVKSGSPSGSWINTFDGEGDSDKWEESSSVIQLTHDGSKYVLHTYVTPSDLSSDFEGSLPPYFYVATSSSSGSYSGLRKYRPSEGRTITGANSKASITEMSGSHSVRINSDVTTSYVVLYFDQSDVWYELEQTLNYAAGSGSGDVPATTYHMNGSSVTAAAANTFTAPTGYHFDHWSGSDENNYAAGASVTMNSNITLTAIYAPNTHSLSWDTNGGAALTGEYTSGTVAYGTEIVKPNTPTRTGYVFKGWAESENGDVVAVPATMPDADKTYYAQWLAVSAVESECWDGAGNYLCEDITNLATPKPVTSATWSGATWGGGEPTLATDVVIPNGMAMTVDANDAKAKSVQLTGTATLKINADAGLVVEEGITKDGNATTSSDLDILSTSDGTGALITAQKSTNTQAGVQFYTKAKRVGVGAGTWVNQYFGIPLSGMNAYDAYYDTYIYVFDVATDAWQPLGNNAAMTPFTAYNIMRDESEATTLGMAGTLNLPGIAADKDQVLDMTRLQSDIDATKKTENMFANSWTAPIAVGEIATSDFVGAEATIYIFNAGTRNEQQTHKEEMSAQKHSIAGQWYYMPVEAVNASPDDFTLTTIPSQQAFLVMATGEAAATHKLTLDYKKVVYDPAVASGATIDPLRAPKRVAEDKATVLNVYVEGTESANADELLLFEREDFSTGYDNGWEAKKLSGASFTPQLYSLSEDGNKAIDAVPDVEGTILGFKAGSDDNQYTFSFKYDSEAEPLYLYDMDTKVYTRVEENSTYTFNTNDKETHNRFALTRRAQQIVTGVEDVTSDGLKGSKTTKFIENGQLYILRDGRIYNAEGSLVK